MAQHLQKEIDTLKKRILELGTIVEEAVRQAIQSLERRDASLAQQVIDNDNQINQMEVEIEEEGLKMLALHQPVAIDLRFIVSVMKINSDLERIGDLAVNIAERASFLVTRPEASVALDFGSMAKTSKTMLKESLDALVQLDSDLARKVCADDDTVDAMNRDVFVKVQQGMRENPDQIELLVHLLSISRHLERIGDHATNIAEDVIYMVEGEIIRHHPEEYQDQS